MKMREKTTRLRTQKKKARKREKGDIQVDEEEEMRAERKEG